MDDVILNGIQDAEVKEPQLLFDKELKWYKSENLGLETVPNIRKDVINLNDTLDRKQIQELYNIYIRQETKSKQKYVKEPFKVNDPIKLETCEDMAEFWAMVAEAIPEDEDYKEISEYWISAVKNKNDKLEELEAAIRDLKDPDLFKLAGIECAPEKIIKPPAREEVAEKLKDDKDYPKNFNVDFSGDYVTINKVPTNIATVFVKDTYIGLTGLLSHDRAIRIICKIIKKKIDPLFQTGGSHGQ